MKEEFCSVGLLAFALNGDLSANLGECGRVLAGVIREHYPERVGPYTIPALYTSGELDRSVIMGFNDHPDTTFEDVERVFEKAEVAWDERI